MKIKEVRKKYPSHTISYLPKKDYVLGIINPMTITVKEHPYEDIYLAKDIDNKYYLLYPSRNSLTGSFINREKAIEWFRKGGR